MYAFIDESGDAQLTKKSTKFFILTAILFENPEIPRRIARSVFKKFKLGKEGKSQLHANKDLMQIKIQILSELKKENYIIEYISIKKRAIDVDYYLEAFEKLFEKEKMRNIDTCFVAVRDLRKSYKQKLSLIASKGSKGIYFFDTESEKGLQIADFASWCIFQHYEKKESAFYKLLE